MEEKLSYQEFKDIVEGLKILSKGEYKEKNPLKLAKWIALLNKFDKSIVMISHGKKYPDDYLKDNKD